MTNAPQSPRGPRSHHSRRGWYYGWNIVAVSILSQAAANGLPLNAFSLFLHDWSVQLHAPISSLQLAIAALGTILALLSPTVGALADKYSARLLLGSGVLGIGFFHLCIGLVRESWQLLALYVVLLPVTLLLATSLVTNAVVSRWFVQRRGLALGLSAFGLGVAGVVLPPAVAILMPLFGWRAIWLASGMVITLLLTPLVLAIVRDHPSWPHGVDDATTLVTSVPHRVAYVEDSTPARLTWRDVFRSRNFRLLAAVFVPMLALYTGCVNNIAPYAASRQLSGPFAGSLLSAFSLSHVGSTLLTGALSDRFGNRRPLAGLALLSAIGALILAGGHTATSIAIGVMLVGMSGGMWPLITAAIAIEFGAGGVGRGLGRLMLFLPITGLTPFIVSRIQENTGSYVPAWSGLSLLTFIGGTACLLMRERNRGTYR